MKANIVIGAGFGDEGKGIITDHICRQVDHPIVIRFSGGPQAGHTVMHKDGKKHIFSNFGSGTLSRAPTYFSKHTCIYPATLMRELSVLRKLGVEPQLYIDPMAKIITPYDVIASRNDKRNRADGTCGLGIAKTMKRNLGLHKLYAIDLLNPDVMVYKMDQIATGYGVNAKDETLVEELHDFWTAVYDYDWDIKGQGILKEYTNLVFEGSQGIMLDMDHGFYPHVTYANTTSKNAHEICDNLDIKERNVVYVTRSYSTRHGSGPFKPGVIKLKNTEHETNVFNDYQGAFKTAPIDYDLLNHAINIDRRIYSKDSKSTLAVTCLDQFDEFDYNRMKSFFRYLKSASPYTENVYSDIDW